MYCTRITDDTTKYHTYARNPTLYGLEKVDIYKYKSGEIILNNEKIYAVFQLPIKKEKVEDMKIKFNQSSTYNDNIDIKELHLKRETTFIYDPKCFLRAMNH